MEQTELLNEKFSYKTLVHSSVINQKSVYKLYLGQFETRSAATKAARELKKANIESFIKNLSAIY